MTVDFVLGGTVFAGDDLVPTLADLRLSDGAIAEVAAPGTLEPGPDAAVLDARGTFVLPGFVDCHDHLRNLTPGLAAGEGLALDDFLRVLWELGRQMGPEEYRLGALLGSVQRLRAGITTVVDHAYTFHTDDLEDALLAGLRESGIRSVYARGVMTRPYEPVSETWELAESRIRALVDDGRVARDDLAVAPVSIRQASPEDYRRCVELAADLDVRLYTHVSETAAEVDVWRAETGTTPIHALDGLGFLNERTVLVHCVQLEPSEIEVLAARGTSVIHCPTNHLKLAKGFTPVPDLLAAGVTVALGVDMMADMLVEIRTEMGMHAAYRRDPGAVHRVDALRMATANGARALGWSDVGTIAGGMRADLVVIDGRNLDHGPVIDPVHNLIYTANSGMVRHVLVDGRAVVRDGRVTTLDEAALHEEAEKVVGAYLERIGAAQPLWWSQVRG